MNHQEALQKYLGKLEPEPGFDAECVAWTKLYNEKVFGKRPGSFGGTAISCWRNNTSFDLNMYDRVEYQKGMIAPKGASIFWDESYNPGAGHTAIGDLNSTATELKIVEQNGTGNPGDAPGDEIRRAEKTYKGVVGWYIPKDQNVKPMSVIDEVWAEAQIDPELKKNFKRYYTGYSDDRPITGAEARKINDLLILNLRIDGTLPKLKK